LADDFLLGDHMRDNIVTDSAAVRGAAVTP